MRKYINFEPGLVGTWQNSLSIIQSRYWDILLGLVWVTILLFIILQPQRISQDAALELQTAQLLLDGKRPYVDFVHIDPPLIIYLSAIPVLLARLLSVNVAWVFSLLVLGLILWSTLTVKRLYRQSGLAYHPAELGLLLFMWAFCSLLIFKTSRNFGQREHLFILLFFPAFVGRWIRWQGGQLSWPLALSLGAAAGLGTCLKPQFGLMVLAPELYWLISRRNIRYLLKPEGLAFIGVGLLYALHFLFLPDSIRDSLFGRWLPFIIQGYHVYDTNLISLIMLESVIFATLVGVLVLLVSPRGQPGLGSMSRPLAVLTLAGVLIYLLQRKGWTYHALPAFVWASMALTLFIVSIRSSAVWRWGQYNPPVSLRLPLRYLPPLVFIVVVGLLAGWIWERAQEDLPPSGVVKAISAYSQEGDAILIISTSVRPAYPALVQLNRQPGSRYLWSFPIAMLYAGVIASPDGPFPYRSGANMPPAEVRFLDELAEDIAHIRPRLIFVDSRKNCSGCPEGFVISDYLSQVGFARRVIQIDNYIFLMTVDDFALFVWQDEKTS